MPALLPYVLPEELADMLGEGDIAAVLLELACMEVTPLRFPCCLVIFEVG